MAARRSRLLSPTAYLRRGAVYKGLLGGRRGWMLVGAFLWIPRLLKKIAGKNEVVVATEVLESGQGLCLQTIPAPSRKERKATRATT